LPSLGHVDISIIPTYLYKQLLNLMPATKVDSDQFELGVYTLHLMDYISQILWFIIYARLAQLVSA
jgi:hypothetical protein